MTKRQRRQIGDRVKAKNGYSYDYVESEDGTPERVLTHWVIAEKKYGRKHTNEERIIFKDGDRENLHPDNILIVKKTDPIAALKRRRATLLDKLHETEAELADVNKRLKEMGIEL